MKVLYFGGGLGNQIFEYAFYLTLKEKFPNDKIYGVLLDKKFKEHAGGFEIEKIFNVHYPKHSNLGKFVMMLVMFYNKYIKETSLYCHNLTTPNWRAILFNAHKMNLEFYGHRENWLEFLPINLNEENARIKSLMGGSNSVSVHVRRGDFLSPQYAANHANIATLAYYKKAFEYVISKFQKVKYFVFSDDIDWCRDNLGLGDAIYIDWNKGSESYIDMYLMTFSKANIIANSTFSYWGAYLNKSNKLTIYPKKWETSEGDINIFPSTWIGL